MVIFIQEISTSFLPEVGILITCCQTPPSPQRARRGAGRGLRSSRSPDDGESSPLEKVFMHILNFETYRCILHIFPPPHHSQSVHFQHFHGNLFTLPRLLTVPQRQEPWNESKLFGELGWYNICDDLPGKRKTSSPSASSHAPQSPQGSPEAPHYTQDPLLPAPSQPPPFSPLVMPDIPHPPPNPPLSPFQYSSHRLLSLPKFATKEKLMAVWKDKRLLLGGEECKYLEMLHFDFS